MRGLLLSCAAVAVLAGCAGSPPAAYYTLVAPAQAVTATMASARGFMIDVVPVSMPSQVDQPQIMLRDGAGRVVPHYSDRWAGPLPDEFRGALSDTLTRRLGVQDVHTVKPDDRTPVWRVQVDVQRFDGTLGGPVVLDATWRTRRLAASGPSGGVLCRSRVDEYAAGNAVAGVVEAQQRAVQTLAGAIAQAIAAGGVQSEADVAGVQTLGCSRL